MNDLTRQAALQACRLLLRPIASLMLKCGLTWREFAQVSKSAFVEVAGDEYGIRGRTTNISRVSILTGIDRKEVKRQRALLAQVGAALPSKTTDATRVLSGWHQDPDFLDRSGKPLIVMEQGPAPSFEELCRRYGGDIPPSTMLKELKRVGAVEAQGGGQLRAARRFYMPVRFDEQWILNAGSTLRDLGAGITHNLSADDAHPRRFVGRATSDAVDEAALPKFREFIEQHGQEFLERVDEWLTAHKASAGKSGAEPMRLGAGLFFIQDE